MKVLYETKSGKKIAVDFCYGILDNSISKIKASNVWETDSFCSEIVTGTIGYDLEIKLDEENLKTYFEFEGEKIYCKDFKHMSIEEFNEYFKKLDNIYNIKYMTEQFLRMLIGESEKIGFLANIEGTTENCCFKNSYKKNLYTPIIISDGYNFKIFLKDDKGNLYECIYDSDAEFILRMIKYDYTELVDKEEYLKSKTIGGIIRKLFK